MSRAAASNSREELKDQIDSPNFNIKNYIGEYKGRAKIQRLMFLADRSPTARKSAVKLLMKCANTKGENAIKDNRLYNEIFKYGKLYLEDCPEPDVKYLQQNTELNMIKRTKLEDESQKWRNLNQRIPSRRAYLNNAAFLSQVGDFDLAIHKLMDAKEFAELPSEMIECQMEIIKTSVKQGSLAHVQHEANRLFVTYDKDLTMTDLSQIHACMGLYHMRNEKFNLACTHFLQATKISNFSEILTKRDLGIYGALCALGDLKRDMLKVQLVENHLFMNYVNKAPMVKDLVLAMTNSQYSEVMRLLGCLKNGFHLDYYLHKVADALTNAIRGICRILSTS
jgi:COP9 signalosome complex subunit 1